MARPRTGPNGESREEKQIRIYVSTSEHEALRAQAAELGISVSDLLRRSPGQVATIKIGLSEYLSRWEPLNESELRAAVSMVQRIVDV